MDNIEPTAQPFLERHRRFLGLFAIGIGFACFVLVYWIADVADAAKINPPKWLQAVLGLGFLGTIGCEFFAIFWGLHDLAHQFLPEGRLKAFVLRPRFESLDDKQKQMAPHEYGLAALQLAMLPVWIIIGLVVIGVVILLFVGGFAAVGALAGKFFAGWPPWAIVICILLVAILLKEQKG